MKAISLKQPWANWVALGLKTLETRTWSTKYRGPLLICASNNYDLGAALVGKLHGRPTSGQPTGMAIAQCELVDCRPMTSLDEEKALYTYEPGRFVFVLANIKPISPFGVKGKLGIFDVEYKEVYAP